jgi:PAS domain S-box-containing protein
MERERSRRALREERGFFDAAPVAMVVLDGNGEIRVNARAASVLGEVGLGRDSRDLSTLLDADSASLARRIGREVLSDATRIQYADVAITARNGAVLNCDLVASPIEFEGRPAALVVCFSVEDREAARTALRQSEERFRRFFSDLPVPVYRTALDGKIVEANDALSELLGIDDPMSLRGANAADFYVNPGERRVDDRDIRTDASVEDRVIQLRTTSGRVVRVRDMNRVVVDDGVPMFEGVAVDVTQEHRFLEELERRAHQQETLAEVARIALRGTDTRHVMTEAVHRVASVLAADCALIAQDGDERGPVASHVAYEIDSVRERDTIHDYIVKRLGEAPADTVEDLDPADEVNGVPIRGMRAMLAGPDEAYGVIAVAGRGFNPTKQDRDFLSAVAATLGIAVGRCRAQESMIELMRSKDEFIASVSHELRTPLTVVAGLALELEQRWQTFSDGELSEFITLIASESREMGDLIEDLLVAARADIGEVPVYPDLVDLRVCVDQVVASCSLADRARISVSGEGINGNVDPVRFRQIVRNLVTNAIRYGGTRIHVTVGDEHGRALVSVFDDGSGIAVGDRDRIFAAYGRAHDRQGVPGSVGLGLTVSRKLTELMDGSISYRYNRGSYFELQFPLARTPVRAD